MIQQVLLLTFSGETIVPAFVLGQKVKMDGGDIVGIITAACVYPIGVQYQVAWWSNGIHYETWFYEYRLEAVR